MFIEIEYLSEDERTRREIKTAVDAIKRDRREISIEDTFLACQKAFQIIEATFKFDARDAVSNAIGDVISAIRTAIRAVEEAFRISKKDDLHGKDNIFAAIESATPVIKEAVTKVRKLMKPVSTPARKVTSPSPAIPEKTTDVSNSTSGQAIKRKPDMDPHPKIVTKVDIERSFRAQFRSFRINHSVDVDESTVQLINRFLAEIEGEISVAIRKASPGNSMAALKNGVERARLRSSNGASQSAKGAINEIARESINVILAKSNDVSNARVAAIANVCMKATTKNGVMKLQTEWCAHMKAQMYGSQKSECSISNASNQEAGREENQCRNQLTCVYRLTSHSPAEHHYP